MALDFPWEMFLQSQQAKNKNQQQMFQDIQGIGQGVGNIGTTIDDAVQKYKQKKLMDQLVQAMSTQGAPQQGPALPGVGMTAGQPSPASGMGGPSQDNNQKINALMTQLDPNAAIKAHFQKQNASKQVSPWRVVPGMLSPKGNPIQQNELDGTVREVPLTVTPTGRGSSAFGTGSITWDNATNEDKNLAVALYEGRITPGALGYRDRSVAVKLANEYANKNNLSPYQSFGGDVRAGTAKAFATGKPAMNVLSLNTALGHAKSALDAYSSVKNMDQRFLNMPLNKVKAATNDPNIIKLQTSLNALSGELATVFKGSAGTDQEIGHWYNVLSQDLTPGQAISAIQQVNDLLNSRLQALEQMRSQGTSSRPATGPLLSPHAAQLNQQFSKMNQGGGQKIGRFEVQVNQ